MMVAHLPSQDSSEVKVHYWDHPEPHFYAKTVNLISHLENIYPHRFYFALSTDQAQNIHTWYKAEELLARKNFLIVMNRPGHEERGLDFNHISVRIKNGLEASSTQIREKIKSGISNIPEMNEEVLNYAVEHGLYV